MKKTFILGLLALVATSSFAQNAQEVLATAQKANAYFMAKYADPTTPTFVKKIRPSNLWTRAVYYEGLIDVYSINSNQKYIYYTDT